ncbi:MAG: Uma2 family endonuclease [Myxococcota bacterium]
MSNAWPALWNTRSEPEGAPSSMEEWLAQDEDGAGEFVDGRLEDDEMPGFAHELVVSWLIRVVGAWLGARGFVVGSDAKVVVSPTRGRKPDAIVFLPGSKPPPPQGALLEPPDIVVEVVTPTPRDERRDRVEKMADYAQFGVHGYWLVDPALGSFEIFELDESRRYLRALVQTEGRLTDIPRCDGLELDLDTLWAELARLGARLDSQ